MKELLVEILQRADENTVLICGNFLAYYENGEEKFNESINWGDYFEQIYTDSTFVCDTDNMQLMVTLR